MEHDPEHCIDDTSPSQDVDRPQILLLDHRKRLVVTAGDVPGIP
jgi:hypothetical protein